MLEVESPIAGYVRRHGAADEATVTLGTLLAVLSTEPDETISEAADQQELVEEPVVDRESPRVGSTDITDRPVRQRLDTPRHRASPSVRRRAATLGIHLSSVPGTGPHGRIRMRDLDAVDQSAKRVAEQEAVETLQLSKSRRATARRMVQAWALPQFSLRRRVDISRLLSFKDSVKGSLALSGLNLSLTDFLIQALAAGMMAHKMLRSRFVEPADKGWVRVYPRANIGLAVDSEEGLLVPALSGVDTMSLADIARERQAAVTMARAGRLSAKFLADSTFTLSNLGPFGVSDFQAIVSPGEVGVLAVGGVETAPVQYEDGRVEFCPHMTLTFAFDHRLVDGADGARFANIVASVLEGPHFRLV